MFEFLEENLYIMALDQTKKNRLEQEEINLLAAMIDSKVPITAPDFDAYRKEKKPNNPKLQQNMALEGNNPSEFSKRDEVFLYNFIRKYMFFFLKKTRFFNFLYRIISTF